jgi:hypothetical protein
MIALYVLPGIVMMRYYNEGLEMKIRLLWLTNDMDALHVKIDKLNNHIVRFCFTGDID